MSSETQLDMPMPCENPEKLCGGVHVGNTIQSYSCAPPHTSLTSGGIPNLDPPRFFFGGSVEYMQLVVFIFYMDIDKGVWDVFQLFLDVSILFWHL